MSLKRFALVAPLVLALGVTVASRAEANYTYSTSITYGVPVGAPGTVTNTPGVGASFSTTNGTIVTLADIANPGTFLIPGVGTYNLGKLSVTTTSPTPESFAIPYTDIVTIINPAPGGPSGTFTVLGTLTLTNVQFSGGASGGTVSNVYSAPYTQNINVGGGSFTLYLGTGNVNDFFGPPTINNPNAGGNIGGQITAAAVPEPASFVLALVGVPALIVLRRRFTR